jgi:hypothetical protein
LEFQVTGGPMATLFGGLGAHFGVVITGENSTFNNSFAVNFSSTAKFNLGPVQ